MKSFIQVRKRGDNEYLYEVTPYYDSAKKQIRQKVKYLGKNVDGEPVRVRQTTGMPRQVLSYGEFQPLLQIAEELGMGKILGEMFLDKKARTVLLLAFNRILRPLSMRNIESWHEAAYLYKDLDVSSQRLSEFLDGLGDSDAPDTFFKQMTRGRRNALIYDLTCLPSYSRLIDILEYGYKHEGPHAPQVKMSIVTDKDSGIPLMYDLYPGSIVDVTTLFNTIHRIKALGITGYILILDRGFFSKENLGLLYSEDVRFVMPGDLKLKDVKETISREHDTIKDPGFLRMYHDNVLFVKPVTITVENVPVRAYYFYDQEREKGDSKIFFKKLYRVVEELRNRRVKSHEYQHIVQGIAGKYYKYLDVRRNIDCSLTVDVRKNAVSQRVNRMGRFILCYHGEMTWEECLRTYKERDQIEKRFHHLKNDLGAVPMHVQKESTMRGFLFVCFIALILRMRLQKKIEETGLDKNYCVEDLLLELEKIHLVRLENGEQLLTELTKRQKDIIKKMRLESCYQKTGN